MFIGSVFVRECVERAYMYSGSFIAMYLYIYCYALVFSEISCLRTSANHINYGDIFIWLFSCGVLQELWMWGGYGRCGKVWIFRNSCIPYRLFYSVQYSARHNLIYKLKFNRGNEDNAFTRWTCFGRLSSFIYYKKCFGYNRNCSFFYKKYTFFFISLAFVLENIFPGVITKLFSWYYQK